MQKNIFKISYFLLLILKLSGDETKQGADQLTKDFDQVFESSKKTFTGIPTTFKQMGTAFGAVPQDYVYSFRVFNDTPVPIYAAEQKITGVMGTNFYGTLNKSIGLASYADTGSQFYDRHLYFSIWVSVDPAYKTKLRYPTTQKEYSVVAPEPPEKKDLKAMRIYDKPIYSWKSKDENRYFYRAYTNHGEIKVEFLDAKIESPLFSGQFFNNTDKELGITFEKDGRFYSISLDPNSFNILQSSTKKNSIRPPVGTIKGFQLYRNTIASGNEIAFIPINPFGIGNLVVSKDPKQKTEVKDSLLYSYEIYESNGAFFVDSQGLSIGNFSQPTTTRVRDINPVECVMWYKSAQQEKNILKESIEKQDKKEQKEQKEIFDPATPLFDIPEQVWAVYSARDSEVYEKLTLSNVQHITFIRPRLDEQEGWLFVIGLNSTNDEKSKAVLKKIVKSDWIKRALASSDLATLFSQQSTLMPNRNGILIDEALDVEAVIILADCFLPNGVGAGPFYYAIEPSVLRVDQFANSMFFDKKFMQTTNEGSSVKKEVLEDVAEKLKKWISLYRSQPEQVKKELQDYLIDHIDSSFVKNQQLTKSGLVIAQSLLTGAISVKRPPLMRKSGINYFIFNLGACPTQWPEKEAAD